MPSEEFKWFRKEFARVGQFRKEFARVSWHDWKNKNKATIPLQAVLSQTLGLNI